MKKQLSFLALAVGLATMLPAQQYHPFEQVAKYTKLQKASKYDSSLIVLTNRLGAGLHYLYPLYQAIGWESRFKKQMGEKNFNAAFSDYLCFAGDYTKAIVYQQQSFDTLSSKAIEAIEDTVDRLRNIQYLPAKTSVIDNAPYYQVIMINESHNKPVHRAFTCSLLEDLYKAGYRYFAMEAFNNYSNKCLDSLNVFTGYYTNEPVAGELTRKALALGFRLIAYEDTLAASHTNSQRDSVQAENIFRVLQKDPSAKILVHAGGTHISEQATANYIPMAKWFKKISGVDPFTIDQTGLTEGGEFAYGKVFYQYFNTKYKIETPSVIFQQKRPFNPLEEKGYDITVMHPATSYKHNRPTWLSFDGERKIALIQPTEKMLFFVQAYYSDEYDEEMLSIKVPADQTYITNREGYYPLYLKKGNYKLVMRDVSYKILSVKDLVITE